MKKRITGFILTVAMLITFAPTMPTQAILSTTPVIVNVGNNVSLIIKDTTVKKSTMQVEITYTYKGMLDPPIYGTDYVAVANDGTMLSEDAYHTALGSVDASDELTLMIYNTTISTVITEVVTVDGTTIGTKTDTIIFDEATPYSDKKHYSIYTGGTRGKFVSSNDVRQRLKARAEEFNEAAINYTSTVASRAKSRGGTTDQVEQLAKELAAEDTGKRLTFSTNPSTNAKTAAFYGYAEFINQLVETGELNKIDLSDSAVMIDYDLTQQVLSKLRNKKISTEYKGYKININALMYFNSYFGTLEVKDKNGNMAAYATIYPSVAQTEADLQKFAAELKSVATDAEKQALSIVVSDLIDLTTPQQLWEVVLKSGFKKTYKQLARLGFGNVVKNIQGCYQGYEAIHGIVNCINYTSIDSIVDNPAQLVKKLNVLDDLPTDASDKVVHAAEQKLHDAAIQLIYAAQDYSDEKSGETPTFKDNVKSFFEKTKSWVTSLFQCPVDFTVYNEDGEVIGYTNDGEVYYNDDIYIELDGDVKRLYVPEGMKVDVKMTGTDEGEMDYVIEEYKDGEPTGRLNYYGLALSDGTEYTQSLDSDAFAADTDALPIESADGSVAANEYISSDSTDACITIVASADDGGAVTGAGEYVKGDSVTLAAVPMDDNYIFNGWSINDELVSTDGVYRFAALEDTEVHAEFIRNYQNDSAYTVTASENGSDYGMYVYTDTDGTHGIVAVPFVDSPADDMTVYTTAVLNNGTTAAHEYTAQFSDGAYVFEDVDLSDTENVTVFDADMQEIATINYSGSIVENIDVATVGNYSDSNISATDENGHIIVTIEDMSEDNVCAYIAKYDDNNILLECDDLVVDTADNSAVIDTFIDEDCTLMLWDKNMCPITEAVRLTF